VIGAVYRKVENAILKFKCRSRLTMSYGRMRHVLMSPLLITSAVRLLVRIMDLKPTITLQVGGIESAPRGRSMWITESPPTCKRR
jgi:hypothetical protein